MGLLEQTLGKGYPQSHYSWRPGLEVNSFKFLGFRKYRLKMKAGHVELRVWRIFLKTGRLILAEDHSSLMCYFLVLSCPSIWRLEVVHITDDCSGSACSQVTALYGPVISNTTGDLEKNMFCPPGSKVQYFSFIFKGEKSIQRQSRMIIATFPASMLRTSNNRCMRNN